MSSFHKIVKSLMKEKIIISISGDERPWFVQIKFDKNQSTQVILNSINKLQQSSSAVSLLQYSLGDYDE